MSVITIDCNYIEKEIAAAFLMIEGEEAAFIETNTVKSVPRLLQTLEENKIKKEKVKYIIITHVHLDHAGGTSELLNHCPNAIVLAHPKATPHIIDPKRLIDSSIMVYGKDKFYDLYGEIKPISEDKVRVMKDNETLNFGKRELKFIFTRGHANHHFVIFDSKTNGVFTGDSFGIGYRYLQTGKQPFIFPSTTPTDFDVEEAKLSIQKILDTGADKVYLTHFGEWYALKEGAEQLLNGLEKMEIIRISAINSSLPDNELHSYCTQHIGKYFEEELLKRNLGEKELAFLEFDRDINAMGLAHSAKRARAKIMPPIQ